MTFPSMPPVQSAESLPELVRRRKRRMWIAVPLGMVFLIVCLVGVGAWLWSEVTPQYPDAGREPAGSIHVRTSTGSDTDEPVIYTASVVDVPDGRQSLYRFYRGSYAESDGWAVAQGTPKDSLCLVNTSDPDVIRVLEARPFAGAPEARRSNRFLVISSEFDGTRWESKGICGEVDAWLDCDIQTWHREKDDGTLIPCYDPRIDDGLE